MKYAETNTAFAQLLTTMIGSNERIPDPMTMKYNIMQSEMFKALCSPAIGMNPDDAMALLMQSADRWAYRQVMAKADAATKAAGEVK